MMTVRALLAIFALQEDLNFLLTNRIPRRVVTRFIGWFSKIQNPLIRDLSIGIWSLFSDIDLSDARKKKFDSMHDCFVRELTEGARPIDPDPATVVSPCDAIVGACGMLSGTELLQIKGFPYALGDLLQDSGLAAHYRDGRYVTLRLTAGMYHRFHAPHDCVVERVDYISGDTWNVNPIALKRIERLFCRNERAIITTRLTRSEELVTLVPVAAILVASIRLHFIDVARELRSCGAMRFDCDARFLKGQELGWFEHGSTIIVLATGSLELCEGVREGARIRMGESLMRLVSDLRSDSSASFRCRSARARDRLTKVGDRSHPSARRSSRQ
jgi:phosphatidylserine decarboxylase